MSEKTEKTPYRQIRAIYDDHKITVYQAYCEEIAEAAVREQKLSASPLFKPARFTWIKPSWCWMMYRSGYGTKDKGQARILAIRMKHENFETLLKEATVTSHSGSLTPEESRRPVRVQWDPERDFKLKVLPYRSIQIGVGGEMSRTWADRYIESIEDVTEKAHKLKKTLAENPDVEEDELMKMGLMPNERIYEMSDDLRSILQMDVATNE